MPGLERSDRSLLEAGAFDDVRRPSGKGAHELWPRPGAWQMLEFSDTRWESEQLRALVEWSGAPACFAVVYDSDVAHVVGLAPGGRAAGREWKAVLGLEVAAEMSIERPEDLYDDDLEWIESQQYTEALATEQAALAAAVPPRPRRRSRGRPRPAWRRGWDRAQCAAHTPHAAHACSA